MPTLGGAENAEILLPLPLAADAASARNREDYNIIGKLKPGVDGRGRRRPRWTRSPRACGASIPDFYPANGGLTFDIVPLQEQVVGDVRRSLADPDRGGRLRAADRVRQRRQPAAVARAGAAQGDRRARGARRQPRAHRSPAADRKRAAGARRRRARPACFAVLEPRRHPRPRRAAACRGSPRSRFDGEVLLFTLAVSVVSGVAVRSRAGAARLPPRSARQPQGRQPRVRRRERAVEHVGARPEHAPAARDRGARAVGDAARSAPGC